MHDTLDRLVDNVKDAVIDTCARCAEIHTLRAIENDYQRGYAAAALDIAAKIRELKQGKV